MASPGLTREEIALSILNGCLASFGKADASTGALDVLEGPVEMTRSLHQRVCGLAFQLADAFIEARDWPQG